MDEHTALVRPLIHALLHIAQLQSPVLVHHLTMVVWQRHSVFIPLDGVIGVTNHTTVNESVATGHGCDVPHGPDTGRTCKREKSKSKKERERKREKKKTKKRENVAGRKG